MGRRSDARQRIVDSALSLMNERGYTGVVVEDIMRSANVGKSSFYHFFPSKDALGEEVMKEYGRRWVDEILEESFGPQHEPLDRPFIFVQRLAKRIKEQDPIEGFWPASHAATSDVATESMRSQAHEVFLLAEQRFSAAFQEAIAEHDLMPNANPTALGKACVAYIHGLMMLCRAEQSPDPMQELGPLVARLWEPFLA